MPPEGTEAIVKPAAEHGEFLRFGILAEIAAFHDVLHKLSTTPCIGGAEHLGFGNVENPDILDYISVGKEASMSYDSIVTEILSMSAEKRWNLLMEIASSLQPATNCSAQNKKRAKRKLGGFEEGFFMADDFNKTPECFKEYL